MEIQDYLQVFRAHWLAIVAITALGAVAAFGWTLTQPKVYTATGSAIITAGASTDLGSAMIGDNYAKSRVKSYLDIAKSRKVGEYAAEELGLDSSPDALVGRVTVSNPLDTAVLRVSANGPAPEDARDLAEAWIAGMTSVVTELENVGDTEADQQSVVSLQTLDSAVLPTSPSSPNVKLAVALGTLVGLSMGVGYALVRAAMDRRLRKPEDVEREFALPVIGALPLDESISKDGVARGVHDFAMKESVRSLRTNLQFMDVDNPPRVIVVTSSLPNDGKSTAAIMLAEAIAESGKKAILIDADLRRPTVAKNLGLEGGAGLTDVLVGRAEASDLLQPYGESSRFWVMAAGIIPPNPSELLGSDAMHDFLYSFDPDAIVLVDTPPLIPVTDAAVLTARTDGALVVARAGKTTIDVLDRALSNLDRVKGRALGIILNGVARKGAHKDAYAYSYSYEQASSKDTEPKRAPKPSEAADTHRPQHAKPRHSAVTGEIEKPRETAVPTWEQIMEDEDSVSEPKA